MPSHLHPPSRTIRPARILPALLLLALLLTACTSTDSTATSEASFTETDTAFLRGMVPHHGQAVAMARLVPDRAGHPDELGGLADDIIASQESEITTMNGFLEQAGEESVDVADGDGMDEMDHGGDDDMDTDMEMDGVAMSGMMSAEDMTTLTDREGDAFDGLFLEMMIAHHTGAIESAQQVLDAGDGNPEVAVLAEEIIAAQEAEIEQMESWQQEWGV